MRLVMPSRTAESLWLLATVAVALGCGSDGAIRAEKDAGSMAMGGSSGSAGSASTGGKGGAPDAGGGVGTDGGGGTDAAGAVDLAAALDVGGTTDLAGTLEAGGQFDGIGVKDAPEITDVVVSADVRLSIDVGGSGGAGSGGMGGTGATGGSGGLGAPVGRVETGPTVCAATADAGDFSFEKIAPWRDDARAAYAMIHDDMCGPGLRGIDMLAVPALAMRGLIAGLGPFVEVCEAARLWDVVKDAESRGNEIVSHSYTHQLVTAANATNEVVTAKKVLDGHLRNPISFYVFPFDHWTAATLKVVADAGHIGARAGLRDSYDAFDNPPINSALPGNDMELVFDVWPRSFSKYALYPARDVLNIHVFNAIEKGGFALREFHSVSPRETPLENGAEGFGPVPLRTYEAHLDFLVNAWKANLVWTSTPSAIVRYRQARAACSATVGAGAINFGSPSATCTKYATPLSVIVKSATDVPGLKATQAGVAISTRKLGAGRFSVTADPTKGSVALEGCATAIPTVDPTVVLPARPTAAQTVCDLETVKGTGSNGQMDNFERDQAFLQVLPNPQQADGRTGTWSWYPTAAAASIVREGTNSTLRWSGGGYNIWSGVTLAFLGGNGAGTCYDARAYKGVRFQIKGAVNSTDLFLNTVFVSLVTAETQSQKYGGDLKGEGGHFIRLIKVTPEWQTVTIPWTDLDKPNWGTSALLTQPAIGKLQAVDWGVSDKATTFEIFLENVELY